jgi:hypothetical protein
MPPPTWSKVTATNAAAVSKMATQSDKALALLKEGQATRAFFDLLMEKQHHLDAIRFLAAALPKQEAVWWACLCARQAHGASTPAKVMAAVQATEKWVREPNEENRRATFAAAEAAELKTPAGCAAMAAFWSGGSLGPPHTPVVPPGEQLTAHGVAGAVLMAAVLTEPEKAPEKHTRFLAIGQEVAAGSNRWK